MWGRLHHPDKNGRENSGIVIINTVIPTPHQVCEILSSTINPIFLVLLAEDPLLSRTPSLKTEEYPARPSVWPATLRFWIVCGFSIGLAIAATKAGKRWQIWPGHPAFPSGHTTMALACAYCLVARRGRAYLWPATVFCVLMGVALVGGHWHTPVEIIGALVPGLGVPFLVWRAARHYDWV